MRLLNPKFRNTSVALLALIALLIFAFSALYLNSRLPGSQISSAHKGMKLYWFVPDGLRADPETFRIFDWAREGKLPNLKRMMDQGAYGYSVPVFPSHTPVNFASLFTGLSPIGHGVADGPIRQWGYPVSMISMSGFSSVAKTVDPFWLVLEKAGLALSILSVPGSTPPEIFNGNVIKGRWGGWGIEFPNMIFHTAADAHLKKQIGWNDRVFGVEKRLTEFVKPYDPLGWGLLAPQSYSPPRETKMSNWGRDLFVLLTDSKDDGRENYDTASFSFDKKQILFSLKEGEWGPWFKLHLEYEIDRQYQKDVPGKTEVEQRLAKIGIDTSARVRVIKLGERDFFRIRVLYDGMNESLASPRTIADELIGSAGPMVDFPDNFPPQLIYFDEDKRAFLDEAEMSFEWHRKAVSYLLKNQKQEVLLHSIYTPNQMLTSRWWMGRVDPKSIHYEETSAGEREKSWDEVLTMYKRVDEILGEALDAAGPDSFVVLSSDHGAAPLNKEVRLNNFFASKGWLVFDFDRKLGVHRINWKKTKVVFLNMNHIFINPLGLDGAYEPARGGEYESLVKEVSEALRELKDETGASPLDELLRRSEAVKWMLPENRVGDLIIANKLGYGWVEDVSEDHAIFVTALKAGYKQAISPSEPALWTPFAIVGPGVRAGFEFPKPIHHLDQYPTVMKLLGIKAPYKTDREPLGEIFTH